MATESPAPPPGWIAGWPVVPERFELGKVTVEMLTVADLDGLVDRERLLRDDSFEPPYWALVWSGARLVGEWLTEIGGLEGATLLDVGCGLGLVGITAAKLGARVTAVDRNADAIAFAAASSERLGCGLELLAGEVATRVAGRRFDVVVAAEVLYEPQSFPFLAESLCSALAPGGRLLLADGFRVDTRSFYEQLAALGLCCTYEQTRVVDEEGTRVRVRLAAYQRSPDARSRRAHSADWRYST